MKNLDNKQYFAIVFQETKVTNRQADEVKSKLKFAPVFFSFFF